MSIWAAEIKELESLYESFKGQLPELEKELNQLIRFDDPNVILLYSRRCLEVIITDLCECELKRPRKTEPLKRIIDKLSREEKVPSYIITSMDSLNSTATFGTHPKEYDPEQVRPVLINLNTIFKWYLKFKNAGSYKPIERKPSLEEFIAAEKKQSIQSEVIIDYSGPVNSDTIESILLRYKQSKSYKDLDKITGKRVYTIIVECLDNISKYSVRGKDNQSLQNPYISVKRQKDKIFIKAGNVTNKNNKVEIINRINQINALNKSDLKLLYEKKISSELRPEEDGAGLGFIIMALKSENRIQYSFTESDSRNQFVEIQIQVNAFLLKKLIIKRTLSSPQIYFDPDKNIYEISGESRPQDVPRFFEPIMRWMDEFSIYLDNLSVIKGPIEFNLNFEYFNSLSAKYILDFCRQIANIRSKGKNIVIKWHYDKDDNDMLEAGREMSSIAKIPFEFIQND